MSHFWKIFLRVLRSYNIEEKVISLIFLIILVLAFFQTFQEILKSPTLFAGEGGFYTEGIVNDKSTVLNPLYADFSDANRDISSLIFSGLTRYDPKSKSFVNDLANLTLSEDKKTYRFSMKDNLFWHDSQPLTVDDVYFTFHDVIQNEDYQNPVVRANFEGVEIKKIDDKTIEFKLNRPNSFFITNLSVGILPKHLLQNLNVAEMPYSSFNLKPVGSGPYKVDDKIEVLNDGRERVILSAWDKYYAVHPKIKNIRFNIYPTAESLIKERNTLNIVARVSKDFLEELKSTNRFSFMNYALPQYTAVFMNMDSSILAKDKVRLALQKAVDKTKLLAFFDNKAEIQTPLVALNQSEWSYKPDLEEAKGALFDSGYKVDKKAVDAFRRDSKGKILKLGLLVRKYDEGTALFEETKKLTDFLVSSWAEAGVQIEVQMEDLDTYNDRISKRDYDLLIAGQSLGYNLDIYSFWHSSQLSATGLNLSNYKSFAADSLIEKIRGTFDNEMKQQLFNELAKTIAQDIPAIFLYRPSYILATDNRVKGIDLLDWGFISDRFANISNWCINCK